ncbi:MBL fold metallo-hydrolase [Carboxydochorda subterranea]|uniref:MBL fold metallo-hydrolase n=1 Tax=Carboxydichorda subterranea TaxID=3109565 RepID=A0ABZ1BYY2_9FIRM|nr:MBL fold metallo-hydrolase [Limnochorda sp. L945t]WRP17701.1 MBL fold metallo-hydrolase [Limnochorda sp. L945t]
MRRVSLSRRLLLRAAGAAAGWSALAPALGRVRNGGRGAMAASTNEALTIRWLGHSAFLIKRGPLRLVTDPFADNMGYPPIRAEADVVTVSHEHFDHNNVQAVQGRPRVFRALKDGTWRSVDEQVGGELAIRAFPSYHDDRQGQARGKNGVFLLEWAGVRIVHLGDLGHRLGAAPGTVTAEQLKPVHLLLIPVGGYYTIDAAVAREVVSALQPSVVVPMHYRTRAIAGWPLAPVDDFIAHYPSVRRIAGERAWSAPPAGQPEVWLFAEPAT